MNRRRLIVAATLALPAAALAAPEADRISLETAREALSNGEALLIDIREPDEHALGVAPDARLLPLSQIAQRVGEIPRDQPVLLICRTQNRSGRLVQALRKQGYDNVRYVDGGMNGWQERGYATVPPR